MGESFSQRLGYTRPPDITVREDAPKELRHVVLPLAIRAGLTPRQIRDIVCRVLRKRAHAGNLIEYPNIFEEAHDLVHDCEWFRVYDIIEAMLNAPKFTNRSKYCDALNRVFVENGIGWQIEGTKVVSRGTDVFESSVRFAITALAGRPTAEREIKEALLDLSRRPAPDLTGAIHHGMGALECVARDLTGEKNATLGEIIKRNPGLLPPPLDQAIEKVWGYSSNYARHVSELRAPTHDETELVVGLAAVVATYLSRKTQ